MRAVRFQPPQVRVYRYIYVYIRRHLLAAGRDKERSRSPVSTARDCAFANCYGWNVRFSFSQVRRTTPPAHFTPSLFSREFHGIVLCIYIYIHVCMCVR